MFRERIVAIARCLAVGFWRNHRSDLPAPESPDQRIGIVSLVTEQGLGFGVFDQGLGAGRRGPVRA
jgi:hypothetical protein